MAKKEKTINPKDTFKTEISKAVAESLTKLGYNVDSDHTSFGFTRETLVIHGESFDLQVKFMSVKTGETRYQKD